MAVRTSDDKIKVAFFDEAVAFGGSVVVLAHLFNHIDRSRFVPQLVTSLDEDSLRSLFRTEDVLCWFRPKLHYASRARWMNQCPGNSKLIKRVWAYLFTIGAFVLNLPAYTQLFFKIAKARPDVIHFNNGVEGLLVANAFGIPMVWHLHGFSEESAKKVAGANQSHSPIVSISRFISNEAIRCGADPALIIDLPNPIPLFKPSSLTRYEWRKRYDIADDAVVLSHVGRIVRWKGQLEFLRAFAEITASCPNAVALIVGDDLEGLSSEYPVSLKCLVAEKGLEKRVIFTGHVTNILELMSFSDIVVHSSIEPEPFGLVITEAMAAGSAVIAARLGAPIEIIDDGVTGLLVDPQNTAEFANGLKTLVRDSTKRKSLALAGKEMAERRYSPQAFATKMGDIYQAVVDRESRSLSHTSSHL